MSMLIPACTVLLTGLSCSVGCGALSTPLLLGRMMGEGRSLKACVMVTLLFSAGKTVAYAFLGFLAAVFGNFVIGRLQGFHPELTQNAFRIINLGFGLLIIWNVFRLSKKRNCSQCRKSRRVLDRLNDTSYFVLGVVYASIPCGPVILALTYAATLAPLSAMVLLLAFGVVNSLFPVVIYAPVIGTVIKAMQKDLPQHFKWLQVLSAVLLILISVSPRSLTGL